MKRIQKLISICLTLCLMLSLLPVQVLAQEGETAAEETLQCVEYQYAADDGADSDALYEAYAQQLFYGGISLFGSAAGETLTGDEKTLYDALVPYFRQIANGERASTTISVGREITYNDTVYPVDAEAVFTVSDFTQEMLEHVVDALLADLPYECYWYEKTTGCASSAFIGTTVLQLNLKFTVADNYRGSDDYTADTAKTGAAKQAAEKAQSILNTYASASDYEKLAGYKSEICALVSYDYDAADSFTFDTDIDPWQLISVFDGDSATNVVCEGYSKAFMYLCDQTDFSGDTACYTVMGTMNGAGHMWNVVRIDGKGYHVDLTCTDSGSSGLFLAGVDGDAASGYTAGGLRYAYDADTLALWGTGEDSILNLEAEAYDPDAGTEDVPAVGTINWEIAGKTLIISGTGNMPDYEAYGAPWGDYISSGNSSGGYVTSIVIQDGITSIGDYAFYGSEYVTSVTIAGSVQSIGSNAFGCLDQLARLTIPSSVTVIEKNAFAWCSSMTELTLSSSLKVLEAGAFADCSSLTSVHIPASVTEFGAEEFTYSQGVFSGCSSMKAFTVDAGNPILTIRDGVLFSKDMTRLIQYPLGADRTEYVIPEGVTTIEYLSFGGCQNLKSITVPDSVTQIQEYAFYYSPALKEMIFQGDAPEIYATNLFTDNVMTAYYPINNPTWTSDVMQDYGGTITWTPKGPNGETAGTHGDNVTWMFDENTGTLTIMGNGVIKEESSGSRMPWYPYCNQITSIVVESGITEIPSYAFEYLEYVETISLPDTLTTLTMNAFNDCGSLNNLIIPASVKTMLSDVPGYYPPRFIRCESLTDAYYLGTEEEWRLIPEAEDITNIAVEMTMHFLVLHEDPATCTENGTESYYTFDDTSVYSDKYDLNRSVVIELGEIPALGHSWDEGTVTQEPTEDEPGVRTYTCTVCGETKTEDIAALKHVHEYDTDNKCECGTIGGTCGDDLTWTLVDGVLTVSGIGAMDSYDITRCPWYSYEDTIETVWVEDGVTSIGSCAFSLCSNLTGVSLPDSVTAIGESAFSECSSLTTIALPDSLTEIGSSAFYCCSNLTAISLPNEITEIPDYAFHFCVALSDVTIPNSVTKIGRSAFNQCHALKTIQIPDGVEVIGAEAFFATGLEHIEIPDSVTVLGDSALNIQNLKSVSLSKNLTDISAGLLMGCTQLTALEIPSGVEYIGMWSLNSCSGLQEITIPASVKEISHGAFKGCTDLKTIRFLGDAPVFTEPNADYTVVDHLEGVTATAYYPADNATWTSDVMQNYGGTITWVPYSVSGTCGENASWAFDASTGTLTISGSGNMQDYAQTGTEAAPWTPLADEVKKLVVAEGITGIGDFAFTACSVIENASFPSTLVQVGEYAFYKLTRPDGNMYNRPFWTTINQTVRQWSQVLLEADNEDFPCWDCVTFVNEDPVVDSGKYGEKIYWELDKEGTLEMFGTGTMYEFWATGCPLFDLAARELIIGEGITNIDGNAFEVMSGDPLSTSLESVTIASTVESIGDVSFSSCSGIDTFTFLGDAPTIGYSAFNGVTATAFYPSDNATWTTDVMQNYGGTITWVENKPVTSGKCGDDLTWEFEVASGTLTISGTGEMYDFEMANAPWQVYANQILTANLDPTVESIGNSAFHNCEKLTSISIPGSALTRIGNWCFYDCRSLQQIRIPESTVSIGGNTFAFCQSLTEVRIPDSVTSIGVNAFSLCDSLESVTIGSGLSDIAECAFAYDPKLTSVEIAEGVKTISSEAFLCTALKEITIPASVTVISNVAFSGCTELTDILFCGDAPSIAAATFEDVTATAHYPYGNATWTSDVMQNYGGNITWKPDCGGNHSLVILPAVEATCSATGLTDGVACENCDFVSRAQEVVPVADHKFNAENVCRFCGIIGGNCGKNITNLKWSLSDDGTLTISGTGEMADVDSSIYAPWNQYADRITAVVVEPGVTTIGNNMLGLLPNLKSVSLPETLVSIGKGAFHTNPALESIFLHDGIQTIGAGAFQNSGLKEVTLPENAYIGPYAFDNCTALTKVTMNTALTASDAGSYLFQNCTALTEVVLGENVNRLSQFMFAGCTALKEITIPGSVKLIAGNAFEGCTALTDVTLEAGVEHIGPNAFERCTALTEITFPGSVTEIEEGVFNRCENLDAIRFTGDAPTIDGSAFSTLKVTAYYPTGNDTWNSNTCNYYGSTLIQWKSYKHVHSYTAIVTAPTCGDQGYTTHICICDHSYRDSFVQSTGVHTYDNDQDPDCNVCGEKRETGIASVPMYRMYDPNSGEHFYTGSVVERQFLMDAGWHYEGVGFNFPEEGAPVYRLYEPVYGEHLYTMDEAEVDKLIGWGWRNEGVAFNSAGTDEVPQYRLHNPNAKRGGYHFTGSEVEKDFLISIGWIYEGIGWYSCEE